MRTNMEQTFRHSAFWAITVIALSAGCAGGPVSAPISGPAEGRNPAPASPAAPAAAITGDTSLNAAVNEAALYFAGQLPSSAKIAITGVEAQTSILSDYIIQELWQRLQNTGKFVMVDRQNQGVIGNELWYNMSGEVDDNGESPAQGIGHFLGADYIIYGETRPFGEEHRFILYASQPERGTSLTYTKNILLDPRFLPEKTLDAAIERAVAELGRNLSARTRIKMDKISYRQYETASDFSDYLKKNILYQAARHDKYEIVDGETYAALMGGSFYPAEDGVVVILHLISTHGSAFIGASKFTIPQAELDRNKVSILPPNTTQSDIERVHRAIAPYDGKNNAFGFTVKSLRPDTIYYDGDTLSLQIYAEKDCYFKVTTVDVQGRQTVMYPVKRGDNNFIRAGETRTLPGNEGFVIDLHEPFGVEYVLVAAYGEQFVWEPERTVQISVQSIRNGLQVRGSTRRDLPKGSVTSNTSLDPLATARFSYTILPR